MPKNPEYPSFLSDKDFDTIKSPRRSWKWRTVCYLFALCLLVLGGLFLFFLQVSDCVYIDAHSKGAPASYVGRASCVECHPQEAKLWHGSEHDRAMDRATEETVLGDFSGPDGKGATLTHFGITSRMYRKDGKYMIHTEGPDGKMQDFEITYVFGCDPLQQYMVEFPNGIDGKNPPSDKDKSIGNRHGNKFEIGQMQVLRVSWDVYKKKWFYLSPPDVHEKLAPTDELHWTRQGQNWNHMCADCHSTNVYKDFDKKTRTYHTNFSEIDVSCEACHGPGSSHVGIARRNEHVRFPWNRIKESGFPDMSGNDGKLQMHACFRCHSRRRMVHPDFRAGQNFYDSFGNSLLGPQTYHPDGQILDEVYVHGSFTQSKMWQKGVRCSDCHDSHSTFPKYSQATPSGIRKISNQLCTSCHLDQHPADKYDTPAHHHHKADKEGASCVACHMPTKTYMGIDPRRDHSMKSPRPDLSLMLGTPNTCTRCHLDRAEMSPEKRAKLKDYAGWLQAAKEGDKQVQHELQKIDRWAAETMIEWYGEKWLKDPGYAPVFARSWEQDPTVVPALRKIVRDKKQPIIIRATAIRELGRFEMDGITLDLLQKSLDSGDPQIRDAAVNAIGQILSQQLDSLPVSLFKQLLQSLAKRLQDPRRIVRIDAARILKPFGKHYLDPKEQAALKKAFHEYKESLDMHSDQPGSYVALATIYEMQAQIEMLATQPPIKPNKSKTPRPFTPEARAYLQKAATAYRDAIRAQSAPAPGPRLNLSEVLYQLGEKDEAKRFLFEDIESLPNDAKSQYDYGRMLYLRGHPRAASQVLRKACKLNPKESKYLFMLTMLYEKYGLLDEAFKCSKRLVEMEPDNGQYKILKWRIQQKQGQQHK